MATIIDMPKLSDTMTVGTVANWLIKEGDPVASGDVIAEIETDKATMELEAFDEGTLLKQIAPVGAEVPVGSPIAAIGEAGESVEIDSSPNAPSPKSESPSATAPEESLPNASAVTPIETDVDQPSAASSSSGGRVKASPLARKLAEQNGIDLTSLNGTGPNGRIVKKDVLAAESSGTAKAGDSRATSVPVDSGPGIAEEADIPVSKMRTVIAQRLRESKNTAPHFYLESEIDVGKLIELRKEVNDELAELAPEQGGAKFSVNDFILKAATEALRRVPEMNRSWNEKTIRQHSAVNISFGVAIDDGLLTPVIPDADAKGLKRISREAKELIAKARSKKLSPAEMSGSTFTVTNLGMFGVSSFYGIINTPNAGILSVGATVARPVVNDAGEIGIGRIMKIGLSCDHRVVDGAVGARFLQALKSILETPALILV
ncbi:MAG: pyruvate dehydrogenase complex dihydrolipoamide acetyltransferase [Opitutales bacterium TMED158]|nr:MAG: pyruvate dehydrogenase complex dihydrolipoamide acetyltransferase [Opitutales bacterium TMED158]